MCGIIEIIEITEMRICNAHWLQFIDNSEFIVDFSWLLDLLED